MFLQLRDGEVVVPKEQGLWRSFSGVALVLGQTTSVTQSGGIDPVLFMRRLRASWRTLIGFISGSGCVLATLLVQSSTKKEGSLWVCMKDVQRKEMKTRRKALAKTAKQPTDVKQIPHFPCCRRRQRHRSFAPRSAATPSQDSLSCLLGEQKVDLWGRDNFPERP